MRAQLSRAAVGALILVGTSCNEFQPTAPVEPAEAGAGSYIAPTGSVRITEIHYDNAGTDVGEAIEISGPAGMNLTGWTLVLYNGSTGAPYGTTALTALDAACGTGGVLVVNYPTNGIQNGSPDGMALVDAAGTVVEFLSYEGPFAAVSGPAAGMTATDIGVSQNGSGAAGQSLKRLAVTTWQGELPHDFGACNYDGAEPGAIASVAVEPTTDTVLVGATVPLTALARDADGNTVPASFTWTTSDAAIATVSATGTVTGVEAGTATITATAGGFSAAATVVVEEPTTSPGSSVWISELHYDNAGTDVNEGVEIEGPAGTSLQGWRLYFYNGSNNAVYMLTNPLTVTLPSQCNGRGTAHVAVAFIQNGNPDAVALIDAAGAVVDFISYGGTITGVNGPAMGMTSRDIGVTESASTGATESLQRKSGTWLGPLPATFGQCNGDGPPPPPQQRVVIFGRDSGDPELPVGFEFQLFADYLVGGAEVPTTFTWRSTDQGIVTVDQRGVVHAVAPGSARVEAVAADGTVGGFTVRTQLGTSSSSANYLNSTEFGIPTDRTPADDHIVTRPQFTSSFNPARNTPNWVSWTLDASQFGTIDRCNCFTADPMLPASVTRITTADYTGAGAVAGYGIDRGHLARSFDRTGAILDNAATFLFTNIIPQTADNNQGPWAALELALGARARTGTEVVYNIAGVAGSAGTVKNEGIITIPEYVWKVAVIMPRGQGLGNVDSHDDVEVVAVVMPNVPGIRNTPWETYRVTVDSVEALSGYDLLALLRDDIEIAVESDTKPPVAALDGPYSAIQRETVAMSAAASSDPDGDALSYAWQFGDGAAGSGVTAVHAYAQPGTYQVRLIVTDVRGLADTTFTTATVISYATALGQAGALVEALIADGAINRGNGQSLLAKLESTLRAIDGDRATALVQLDQAMKQLETFVRARHISADDAAPLRELLERIRTALG